MPDALAEAGTGSQSSRCMHSPSRHRDCLVANGGAALQEPISISSATTGALTCNWQAPAGPRIGCDASAMGSGGGEWVVVGGGHLAPS